MKNFISIESHRLLPLGLTALLALTGRPAAASDKNNSAPYRLIVPGAPFNAVQATDVATQSSRTYATLADTPGLAAADFDTGDTTIHVDPAPATSPLFAFSGPTTGNFAVTDFAFDPTVPRYSDRLAIVGSELDRNMMAIPEPSTYAMLACGLACLGVVWLRRTLHAGDFYGTEKTDVLTFPGPEKTTLTGGTITATDSLLPVGHPPVEEIMSVSVSADGQVDGRKLNEWILQLLHAKGRDIFRLRCVLVVQGANKRLDFQGVYPPFHTKFDREWEDGEKRTNTFVVIGLNLDRAALTEGFQACTA